MHGITNALPELREKADVLDKKIGEKEKNNDRIIKDSCSTQKENGQIELSIKNIYQTLMSADNKSFVDKSMSAESAITAIGMKLDDICRMLNADKQINNEQEVKEKKAADVKKQAKYPAGHGTTIGGGTTKTITQ